jgi:hypothetical protein
MSITQAQTLAKTYSGSGTTGTATFGAGVTNGNLLVARVAIASGNQTYNTPTGWTLAAQANTGTQCCTAIFFTIVGSGNSFGGTTAFAFSWGATHSFGIEIEEWNSSTGWQASPLDKVASVNGSVTSTALDSGTTATTTQAVELWVAAWVYKSGVQTITGITSGWTEDDNSASSTNVGQDSLSQVVSSTGAARAQGTLTTTAISSGAIATFIPASVVAGSASLISNSALAETTAQILDTTALINTSTLAQTVAQVLESTAVVATTVLAETAAQVVEPNSPTVANAALVATVAQIASPSDPLIAGSALASVTDQVVDPVAPLIAQSILSATGGIASAFVNGTVSFIANTVLAENAQVVSLTSPLIASSVLTEAARLVSPSSDAFIANAALVERAQVLSTAAAIASSALVETSAQVTSTASEIASSALVNTSSRIGASAPLVASATILEAAQILDTAALIATSALAGTGTAISIAGLPTVAVTATVRDGLVSASIRDGTVSATVRSGTVTTTVRDGLVQTLCRDGTITAIVR